MAAKVNDWDESEHPRHPAKTPGSKGGQFARVEIGGSGNYDDWASQLMAKVPYKKGRWVEATRPEPIVFERAVRDTLQRAKLSEAEIQAAIDDMDISEPEATLTNGPHTIQDYVGLQPQILAGFAKMVDELYVKFKPADGGAINIAIVPPEGMPDYDPSAPPGASLTGGATVSGTGIMWLNFKTFFSPQQGRFWMPVGQYVNPMSYVVAHEWGHVIDDDADAEKPGRKEFFERIQREHPMSRYAESSPAEAYAEAFAEWFLTTGEPFHPAAEEYAKEFGWPKPQSTHGT